MTTPRPRGPSAQVLDARRIVDLLQLTSADKPDEILYTYLLDDGGERTLTYGELYDGAQRAATLMLEHVQPGDRAILLFGSGLDFVLAFMGCQVAGVVPVPVMPPRSADPAELGRVMAILDDVGTNLIVTSEQLIQMGQAFFQGSSLAWISVEDLDGIAKTPPVAFEDAGDLALLQYTSGSTSRPRGVMVGHDNLMCNLADIYWAEGNSPETISVSWLPMSHDMGLIEGVLQPLYRGSPGYLMSPITFLRQPLFWLELISKVRATVSGGPNFAYDLVLRRLGDDPPPDLDLSCWRFAYNGSEPVSAETMQNFAQRLACRGFRAESLHALFGIAEATLGVTEGRHQEPLRVQQRVGPGGLRKVVSCGVTAPHTELVIVDPDTHEALPDGEEGELWLNGPCVTRGYWRQPDKTREVFDARIVGRDKPYLRTGDLGFVVDGEIYISGRIKEVIVSRGRNVHPQDMELTAQNAHAAVRPGGVVAFAISGQEEAAGVVAELDKAVYKSGPSQALLAEIANEVRRAVTMAHGVPIEFMALVKPGALPRTTSGKRQRLRVAKMTDRGQLDTLFQVQRRADTSTEELQEYLLDRVAVLLGVAPETLDQTQTLAELGLDSLRALELLIDVEARFGSVSLAALLTRPISDLAEVRAPSMAEPWYDDAKLPEDFHCGPPATGPTGKVLLTGATGFLGGTVATRLLATSDVTIVALVRGTNGRARLLDALRRDPAWQGHWASRVEVVAGDLGQPGLGLTEAARDELAAVDAIYHVAAMVNWVYPYPALFDANVGATLELLRLASDQATPFVYVSTSAVCWSFGATETVDEDTDPMTHIDGIHLNYVRTKAVAESLVRQAATRSLPATIIRPGLIFSHSQTGQHSPGDFLSALFKGCIEMGAAPDLDWSLEACTVDDVASAVTGHVRSTPGVTTLHAEPNRRRLWRGAVLWMALRGYDVDLVDYDEWCERLEVHAQEPAAALRPLLPFFTRPVQGVLRLPQLYEESRRNPMSSERSRATLDPPATLDARLLEKTFDDLIDRGYLPAPPRRRAPVREDEQTERSMEGVLRDYFDDPDLSLIETTPVGWPTTSPGEHGIIGELAAWRHGTGSGLRRMGLRFQRSDGSTSSLTAVIKPRVPDEQTLDVGYEVSRLCSRDLGEAWQKHRARSEVCKGHLRETAIYSIEDAPLTMHRPIFYGAFDDALVIEDLTGSPMLNSVDVTWSDAQIAAALDGIGAIHAHWFDAPPTGPWLPPPRQCATQQSLWDGLADVALQQPAFVSALGPIGVRRYDALRADVARWSQVDSSMPQTLIHNDFNPRNIALRSDGRLCAYDWELARVGPAQRDVAEFLCFTLDPDVSTAELTRWVTHHRDVVERASSAPIDTELWLVGFGAALADFMVTRIPLYAMYSRFHPQPFLDRVVRTWVRLDELVGFENAGAK